MKKKSILGMLVIAAILAILMNIHHPVTPTLFSEMNLPSRIFGTSFSAMCFFSFLTSPFWGEMSDSKGRIKVLVISCIGYGIAQFTLGYCNSEATVLLSRSFAGVFASGTSIAPLAYVADLCTAEERGKKMSIFIAIQSVFLAVGYLLGGVLGSISFKTAFTVQGCGMILIGILVGFIMDESLDKRVEIQKGQLFKKINPFASFVNARTLLNSTMLIFIMVVIFSSFGSTCYDNAFNYYLKDQMNFIPIYNGILKSIIGIVGLIANFTINMWIVSKTRVRLSLTVVLLLCSVSSGVGILLTGNLVLFLGFNLCFYTVNAIYQPIIQTLSYEGRENSEIGLVTGLINATKSLGNVAGSLFAGMIYDIASFLPFLAASIFFAGATIFGFIYHRKKA